MLYLRRIKAKSLFYQRLVKFSSRWYFKRRFVKKNKIYLWFFISHFLLTILYCPKIYDPVWFGNSTAPCDIQVEPQKRVLGAKAVGHFVVLDFP